MFPVVFQARSLKVHTVNFAQDSVHGSVYGPPLAGLQVWQRRVFVDHSGAVLHQVEGRANDPGRDTDGVLVAHNVALFFRPVCMPSAGEGFRPQLLDISFTFCT